MDLGMVERYQAETRPPPSGLKLPEKFVYIHYKAYSYLARGPVVYRAQDALGMPPEDTSPAILAVIEHGCMQILKWKGIEPVNPLESIGINGFYRLMDLFHFKVIAQSAVSGKNGTLLDKMKVQHSITGEILTLYNQLKSE